MSRFAAPILLAAFLALPLATASAQSPFAPGDDGGPTRDDVHISLVMSVASAGAGTLALRNDSRVTRAMGATLLGLAVSDLALMVVEYRQDGPDPLYDVRLRNGRIAMLFGGATVASFGAYLGSDISLGAGVALASHSAFRLLLNRLLPEGPAGRPVDVGFSVVPTERGTVATATVGGVL